MTSSELTVVNTADDGQMLIEELRGPFFCRRFVANEYHAVCDVNSRCLELTEVYDPFDGFWDPDDFGSFC